MPLSFVSFTKTWKIDCLDIANLSDSVVSTRIITPRNHVVFIWRFQLISRLRETKDDQFALNILYESGPLEQVNTVFSIDIMRADKSYKNIFNFWSVDAQRGASLNFPNFDTKNRSDDQEGRIKSITYRVTIKIPTDEFRYVWKFPTLILPPQWIQDFFRPVRESIELHDCFQPLRKSIASEYSDIQLISADQKTFHCHRLVLGPQSAVLAAMFRNRSTEDEKMGVFSFPTFNADVLEIVLQFFYKGLIEKDLQDQSLAVIIKVATFADMYQIKHLKDICASKLWSLVTENSKVAMEILQFTDLRDDLKPLKDRSMDVLAENVEKGNIDMRELLENKNGDHTSEDGWRLLNEFLHYISRRAEPLYDCS